MNNLQGIKYTCLLGKRAKCLPSKECETCGFEKSERERRKKHIEKHGLTLGKDGLRRLNVAEIRRRYSNAR